jgi:hypothetical protein
MGFGSIREVGTNGEDSGASEKSRDFQDKLGVTFETSNTKTTPELCLPPSRLREPVRQLERTALEIELQPELHLAGGLS